MKGFYFFHYISIHVNYKLLLYFKDTQYQFYS